MNKDIIDFGQGEVEVCTGVGAMTTYEQEFNRDIIHDLYGKVVIRRDDTDEDVLAALDFRNVNWTSLVRALWACMKTADDTVPSFKVWSKEVGEINLMDLNTQLMPALERNLFRSGAAASE